MDLFIHLLVHLFVYLFIDMSIPLSVHSFRHSFFQILSQPNTFPDCIYWKNASRDLSDCFTLYKVSNELAKGSNASVDLLAFIILGPNKGDQLKKSPCIKDLNCCILKESNQRLIRLLHSLQSFQSMELWINCSIRLENVKCIIQPLHILWRGFH